MSIDRTRSPSTAPTSSIQKTERAFEFPVSAWSLVRADDRGDGSFIGYQSGDRTVTISTGSVAEEEIQIAENFDPDLVSVEDVSTEGANVTRYVADEAVAYVWHTSSELPVVATFGSMSLEEAEQAARLVQSIDPETFARMIESAGPFKPETDLG